MTMDDETVKRYLQAMEPRGAAKIVREFMTPDELQRIQRVIDQMRAPATQSAARPASQPTASTEGN
jgi:hypothetical protein